MRQPFVRLISPLNDLADELVASFLERHFEQPVMIEDRSVTQAGFTGEADWQG